MTHNFKVGDKVKVKSCSEFDLDKNLYVGWEDEVSYISGGEFYVKYVNSGGQITLDTDGLLGVEFTVYPEDVVPVSTKNPRPHAELIKQWAEDDSLEIQEYDSTYKAWTNVSYPKWYPDTEYRIKPKTTTKWKWVYETSMNSSFVTGMYYTEEEFCTEYKTPHNRHKLEWTAKEFEI